MMSYLDIITTISSVLLLRSGTDENFEKKQELWQYLKEMRELQDSTLQTATRPPGPGHATCRARAEERCPWPLTG